MPAEAGVRTGVRVVVVREVGVEKVESRTEEDKVPDCTLKPACKNLYDTSPCTLCNSTTFRNDCSRMCRGIRATKCAFRQGRNTWS